VRCTIYVGGIYEDVKHGISLACPLSLLMGAVYLKRLDERMEATALAYARFMDDWLILAPTRWKLRAAVRLLNETLAELHVHEHPDKTFICRCNRGLDFLLPGVWAPECGFMPTRLAGPRARWSVPRWLRWARSG
jgi:hypothetical protein